MRKAYLRDVVFLKQIMIDMFKDEDRREVMAQYESMLPSLDMRQVRTIRAAAMYPHTAPTPHPPHTGLPGLPGLPGHSNALMRTHVDARRSNRGRRRRPPSRSGPTRLPI